MKTATKAKIGLAAGLSALEIFIGGIFPFLSTKQEQPNFAYDASKKSSYSTVVEKPIPALKDLLRESSFGIESALADEQGQIRYKTTIRDQLNKNDYSGAILTCDSALKSYSNDADFWYYKGFALAETKQFDKAKEAYDKGISIRVDKRTIVHNKNTEAQKHFENGNANRKENPDLAIKEYLISQNLEPDNPLGFYGAAETCLNVNNNPKKAIEYTKKALELKPDFISAIDLLGYSYYKMGEWKEASFYFNLILSIDSNYRFKDFVLNKINECSKHLNNN
jgi:tetratricopeptide (TPR) repeat protein